MPGTAEQIKNIILKHKDSASKQQIARELKMGLDYIGLVCRDLERKGEIIFLDGFYSFRASNKNSQSKTKPSINKRAKLIQNLYAESALLGIPKMTKELVQALESVGYKTIQSLADAPIARLMQEIKLELQDAAGLINRARKVLNKISE